MHDLPLMSLKVFATPDEDLWFGVGFAIDGAPVDLSALTFTLKIASAATFVSGGSALRIIGSNLVCFVPAAQKLDWAATGGLAMSLLAQDETYARALLFASQFKATADPSPVQFGATRAAAEAWALSADAIDALLTAQASMLSFSRTSAFLLA
jgi:hypothetical protein